ncbi:MAG TPA: TlpA family protein disulfide reductase [Candidatus Cryptobacteroides pullicola]|nr:TlpA family protein disulfide reductase [Candidatus Cryptobacteroides pullicola]
MKHLALLILSAAVAVLAGCSHDDGIVELPLTPRQGYGPFECGFSGSSVNTGDETNVWYKTQLRPLSAPPGMSDVEYGDIETDFYQMVYQSYCSGDISPEWYGQLTGGLTVALDSTRLSKAPVKTKIAFALGKNASGQTVAAIDTDNDLELDDEKVFVPADLETVWASDNKDSVALANIVTASVEHYSKGRISQISVPLSVFYSRSLHYMFTSFATYSETEYNGVKIAVRPSQYLTYSTGLELVLTGDADPQTGKVAASRILRIGDVMNIKGEILRIKGVNTENNTLLLEKTGLSADETYAAQPDFKAYPFEGGEFTSGQKVSLEGLRGRYVLVDFWALGCPPCLDEFPVLRQLYDSTDRDDFEIIGIIYPGREDQIREIISAYGIGWPQIMSDKDTNDITGRYGISYFPTTYLIGPDGVIIEKDIRGQAIVDKVLSLLGKNAG